MEQVLLWVAAAIVALFVVFLVGLRVRPRPFPRYSGASGELDTIPLPEALPPPVERFYRVVYGPDVDAGGVPLVSSAVITGRATLRIGPVTMPARFRFTHLAGLDYRHYIEATLFGIPVFKVNESYIGGRGRLELPFGTVENDPGANQAAALGLWAESGWFPALFVTDPRVRWAPVDAYTALLYVPYQQGEEVFIARFDPVSDLLYAFEAMRYRDPGSERKVLWITEVVRWAAVDGHLTIAEATVTWLDQGTPWALFRTEELVLNADVSDYLHERGV
jgi:hypothetical protein